MQQQQKEKEKEEELSNVTASCRCSESLPTSKKKQVKINWLSEQDEICIDG